jgi:glycosyltransferase involved in cell wall biosynthesis
MTVEVCIVDPVDPFGGFAGGVPSFIRSVCRLAPPEVRFRVVGVSADPPSRPVGRWCSGRIGNNEVAFLPLLGYQDLTRQQRIPVTLRFGLALARYRGGIRGDVLEFHRIEPVLNFLRDSRPKTAVMHLSPKALAARGSSFRWRHAPGLYRWAEARILPKLDSLLLVHGDARELYEKRFPALAARIQHLPTFVDSTSFDLPTADQRVRERERLAASLLLDKDATWFLFVGRLEREKDPIAAVQCLRRALDAGARKACLIIVGEGSMRDDLEAAITAEEMQSHVRLVGFQANEAVVTLMKSCDALLLTSFYESMPIAVLEAQASGLPVLGYELGGVRDVVADGETGLIVAGRDASALARAMVALTVGDLALEPCACRAAATPYFAENVLPLLYENYLKLAAGHR